MATRFYTKVSGAVGVTPSTWNFANQINPVTVPGTQTKNDGSAMTSKTEATGIVSPIAKAVGRTVIGPLAAQTISGTAKGQMRGSESNAGANATLAIAIKIIKPDGTDRGVLLAQTASDNAAAPNELVTSLTNSKFTDAAESASLTLSSQAASDGDYLVIEWGFRSATTTTRNIVLSYGNDSATDLPEDTSTTAANNPWWEFSGTVALLVSGTLSATLGAAALSGTSTNEVKGTASATLGAATAVATVTNGVNAALSATLGAVGLSGTGTVEAAGISGSLSATLGNATIASTGTDAIAATLSSTLGTATVSATATNGIAATLATTLGGVASTGIGTPAIAGSLSSSLSLSVSALGIVGLNGATDSTLVALSLSGISGIGATGIGSVTLGAATISASGTAGDDDPAGTLSATLEAVTVAANGVNGLAGSLDFTLQDIARLLTGTVSATLGADFSVSVPTQNLIAQTVLQNTRAIVPAKVSTRRRDA